MLWLQPVMLRLLILLCLMCVPLRSSATSGTHPPGIQVQSVDTTIPNTGGESLNSATSHGDTSSDTEKPSTLNNEISTALLPNTIVTTGTQKSSANNIHGTDHSVIVTSQVHPTATEDMRVSTGYTERTTSVNTEGKFLKQVATITSTVTQDITMTPQTAGQPETQLKDNVTEGQPTSKPESDAGAEMDAVTEHPVTITASDLHPVTITTLKPGGGDPAWNTVSESQKELPKSTNDPKEATGGHTTAQPGGLGSAEVTSEEQAVVSTAGPLQEGGEPKYINDTTLGVGYQVVTEEGVTGPEDMTTQVAPAHEKPRVTEPINSTAPELYPTAVTVAPITSSTASAIKNTSIMIDILTSRGSLTTEHDMTTLSGDKHGSMQNVSAGATLGSDDVVGDKNHSDIQNVSTTVSSHPFVEDNDKSSVMPSVSTKSSDTLSVSTISSDKSNVSTTVSTSPLLDYNAKPGDNITASTTVHTFVDYTEKHGDAINVLSTVSSDVLVDDSGETGDNQNTTITSSPIVEDHINFTVPYTIQPPVAGGNTSYTTEELPVLAPSENTTDMPFDTTSQRLTAGQTAAGSNSSAASTTAPSPAVNDSSTNLSYSSSVSNTSVPPVIRTKAFVSTTLTSPVSEAQTSPLETKHTQTQDKTGLYTQTTSPGLDTTASIGKTTQLQVVIVPLNKTNASSVTDSDTTQHVTSTVQMSQSTSALPDDQTNAQIVSHSSPASTVSGTRTVSFTTISQNGDKLNKATTRGSTVLASSKLSTVPMDKDTSSARSTTSSKSILDIITSTSTNISDLYTVTPRNETIPGGLSKTAKIGIGLGAVVLFWLILGPLVCLFCRFRDKAKEQKQRDHEQPPQESISHTLMEQYIMTELARGREKMYNTPVQSQTEVEKLNDYQDEDEYEHSVDAEVTSF